MKMERNDFPVGEYWRVQYNLEYPEFYTKLYQLFTIEIFHVKYKVSDFFLC